MARRDQHNLSLDDREILAGILAEHRRVSGQFCGWHPAEPESAWLARRAECLLWADGFGTAIQDWLGSLPGMRKRRDRCLRHMEALGLLTIFRSGQVARSVKLTEAGERLAKQLTGEKTAEVTR